MKQPAIPDNEQERLAAFQHYNLLTTLEHQEFKDIVKTAAYVCDTPISMISLVGADTQRFVGRIGLNEEFTSRGVSFCAHAINNPYEPLLVEDARKDDRFSGNPLVLGEPNIVFYAGFPLNTPEEHSLGTLCVIDNKPKTLTAEQLGILDMLSKQVIRLFQLRKTIKDLEQKERRLEQTVSDLEEYTSMVAHDLKTSFRSIEITTEVLKKKHADLDSDSISHLQSIQKETIESMHFINGALKFAGSVYAFKGDKSLVNLSKLLDAIFLKVQPPASIRIKIPTTLPTLYASRTAMQHIFEKLIQNSIKYIDQKKANPKLHIKYKTSAKYHVFKIIDNGIGIKKSQQQFIFDLFYSVENQGTTTTPGGVDLAIVNRLVNLLDGKISVQSKLGKGTTFTLKIPK